MRLRTLEARRELISEHRMELAARDIAAKTEARRVKEEKTRLEVCKTGYTLSPFPTSLCHCIGLRIVLLVYCFILCY
jgi:hypothetical protein